MTSIDPRLASIADAHPYPLVFATVSGAHLYGFPSPDSDWDLRGVHLLPARERVGLLEGPRTIERAEVVDGLELDLVTHEAHKFLTLMLRRNGYVLEQLHSPLVVRTSSWHEELRAIAKGCVTRHHAHHYLGFAATQERLLRKEEPPRVKPLLYLYRVLLTGIHLMRTGEIEASLVRLNDVFRLPQVPDLVAAKLAGAERGALSGSELALHLGEVARLREELERASRESALPELPGGRLELHDLLLRMRGVV